MSAPNAPSVRDQLIIWGATASVGDVALDLEYYGECCDAFGGGLMCTLPDGHGGQQHVAEGGERVLGVWSTSHPLTAPGTCPATASSCRCSKPPGHPEPEHECQRDGCRGVWRGAAIDAADFDVVRFP